MHFCKSYAQILLSLPPELRENAISYRQASRYPTNPPSLSNPSNPLKLKKLVNQVAQELTSLGFSPEVVRDLVEQGNDTLYAMRERHNPDEQNTVVIQSHAITGSGFKLLYEVDNDFGRLVPHLRFVVDKGVDMDTAVSEVHAASIPTLTRNMKPHVPILTSLENSPIDP